MREPCRPPDWTRVTVLLPSSTCTLASRMPYSDTWLPEDCASARPETVESAATATADSAKRVREDISIPLHCIRLPPARAGGAAGLTPSGLGHAQDLGSGLPVQRAVFRKRAFMKREQCKGAWRSSSAQSFTFGSNQARSPRRRVQ